MRNDQPRHHTSFPSVKQRRKRRDAAALHARAIRLIARGDYPAANISFRTALRSAHALRRADPLLLAALLNDFGVLCKYTGRLATAHQAYTRALRVLSSDKHSDHAHSVATLYHNLAGIEFARHRYKRGAGFARRGIAIRTTARPLDPVALACDEAALAAILAESDKRSQALKIFLRTLRLFRRKLGPSHYEVGAVLANLGALYWKMGRPELARRALRRSVSILTRALGAKHPRTAGAQHNLAIVTATAPASGGRSDRNTLGD